MTSNKNEIDLFAHCRSCYEEKPKHKSMREYSSVEAGKTKRGIQIWCKRHDKEIFHYLIDWGEHEESCQCEMCGKK